MKDVKNYIILLLGIALLSTGRMAFEKGGSKKIAEKAQMAALVKSSNETRSFAKKTADTIIMRLKQVHDTLRIPGNVPNQIDTVSMALVYLSKIKEREVTIKFKDDTINQYKKVAALQADEIVALKEKQKNVTVSIGESSKSRDTANADLLIYPFKKKSRATIFSPEKNYIRVMNKITGGTVNRQPFYDFEQTNDEINQFLLQLRTSYNFKNTSLNIGAGAELKVDRIGLNAVWFYNTDTRSFNTIPTFGLRYDFFRHRFK